MKKSFFVCALMALSVSVFGVTLDSSFYGALKDSDSTCCFTIPPIFITGGNDTICLGDSAILSVPYDSCLQYQWYNDGNIIYGANDTSFAASDTGNYYVVIWNNCDTAWSDTVFVLPRQLTVSISCVQIDRTHCQFTAIPSGGTPSYLYSWSTGATTQTITGNCTTTYYVTVTDHEKCSAIAASPNCAKSKLKQENCVIYPNPVNKFANLELILEEAKQVSIDVYDITGKHVLHVKDGYMESGEVPIDMSSLTKGKYCIRITDSESIINKLVILE